MSQPSTAADPWATDYKLAVTQALSMASTAIGDATDARANANAESAKALNSRETIITRLANAAKVGGWSSDDLADTVKDVLKARNATKGAVAQFASEIKRACTARVRPHVEDLFKLAREAFETEGEEVAAAQEAGEKKPATPLRRAFSRSYHAAIAAFKSVGDGERDFRISEDFVEFANHVIRTRETNYNNVHKRLMKIRDELRAFHDDFPLDGIDGCVEFLGEIKAADLKACVDASPAPAQPAAEQDEPEQEPVEGASDILSEINDDLSRLAA